jgi:deoxyribonuclease-4
MYGETGEIKHLDFTDEIYGPDFGPLAEALAEYKLTPVVICESADIMAQDAVRMRKMYEVRHSLSG